MIILALQYTCYRKQARYFPHNLICLLQFSTWTRQWMIGLKRLINQSNSLLTRPDERDSVWHRGHYFCMELYVGFVPCLLESNMWQAQELEGSILHGLKGGEAPETGIYQCNFNSSWMSEEIMYSVSVMVISHRLEYIPKIMLMVTYYCVLLWFDITHILQGCFTGTGAIIWLPQCQWSNLESHGYSPT